MIFEVQGVHDLKDPIDTGPGFLGFWVEADYTFFFFDREPDARARSFFSKRPHLAVRHVHRMKYAQWQDGADFRPFRVGPLQIVPAWWEGDTKETAGDAHHTIRIDPGLAFGFGGHPTTLACLGFLVRVFKEDRPDRVLDLGAGTGVLSLAAARLGAGRVTAVEYSHVAAETARRNVQMNGLAAEVAVIHGLAEEQAHVPAGLVCSNLHFQVQQAVLEAGGFDDRDRLILSGLFHDQAEDLWARLRARGYCLTDLVRDERWSTLLLTGRNFC